LQRANLAPQTRSLPPPMPPALIAYVRAVERFNHVIGRVAMLFLFAVTETRAQPLEPGDYSPAEFEVRATRGDKAAMRDGVRLFKYWFSVTQDEQRKRFMERQTDPLKQWKLSRIDVDGLALWDSYTEAIAETLALSHTPQAPWTVIRADDKRRARLAAIRVVLSRLDYAGRDAAAIGLPDPAICGGPDLRPKG
jgi:hypothetical protein